MWRNRRSQINFSTKNSFASISPSIKNLRFLTTGDRRSGMSGRPDCPSLCRSRHGGTGRRIAGENLRMKIGNCQPLHLRSNLTSYDTGLPGGGGEDVGPGSANVEKTFRLSSRGSYLAPSTVRRREFPPCGEKAQDRLGRTEGPDVSAPG